MFTSKTLESAINPDSGTARFSVKALRVKDVNDNLIQEWADLEQRAIEGNAYLSPYFVLPAIRHLVPGANPLLIFVEMKQHGIRRITGAGVFDFCLGSKRMPLPHLKAYRTTHSFLTGLLIDSDYAEPTLREMFTFFRSNTAWHGVEFVNRYADCRLAKQLDLMASDLGISWYDYDSKSRSVLIPKNSGDNYLEMVLSPKKKKDLRRCKRHLESTGNVEWSLLAGKEIDRTAIDVALQLEHLGWKGAGEYSMLSNPSHEAFFRETIEGFSRCGRAFITKLSANGEVIGATSNFLSGKAGFAFKVGYHPGYAKMSPGILNEIEFVKRAPDLYPGLEYIDSGADEGSFIDELWSERKLLTSGFFATKPLGKAVLFGIDRLLAVKRRVRGGKDA